jgi:ABC-2 type transport system permease protein
VSALLYVLSGPFILLLLSSAEESQSYLRMLMTNYHPIYIMLLIGLPLVTAMIVFRYMHSSGEAAIAHSLPVTRGMLFRSHYLAGLILMFVPLALGALCAIPFLKFDFAHFGLTSGMLLNDPNLAVSLYVDYSDWVFWLIASVAIMMFVFSVTALAGVITGSTALHLLIAGLLNSILPILYLLTHAYTENFLYGFWPMANLRIASLFHPFSFVMSSSGLISAGFENSFKILMLAVYIAAAIAVSVGAAFLYRSAKIERVGEPMIFRGAAYIVTFLVTFIGMAGGGFLFYSVTQPQTFGENLSDSTPVNFYIGALIGAVIVLILTTMVLRKTPKVFNLRTLRDFGLYAIMGIVFLVCTTTNITGFETRLPDAKNLKTAEVTLTSLALFPYVEASLWADIPVSDARSLAALTALHKDILDNAGRYDRDFMFAEEEIGEGKYLPRGYLYIHYNNNDTFGMRRHYTLSGRYFMESDAFGAFAESDAYKQSVTLDRLAGYDNLTSLSIGYESKTVYDKDYMDGDLPIASIEAEMSEEIANSRIVEKKELVEFAKCLDADFARLNYEDMRADNEILLTFAIEYLSGKDAGDAEMMGSLYIMHYSITDKYERSIAWLKEHGYYDDMIKVMDAIDAARE